MILVSFFVFVFVWGYLKKFPRGNRLKTILAVTVFSILVSFLVSFITVYSYWGAFDTDNIRVLIARYNPTLSQLSFPFYLKGRNDGGGFSPPSKFWHAIYLADIELLEMEFDFDWMARLEEKLVIYLPEQTDVNYTIPLFYQLLLMLIPLNTLGVPFAVFTSYKLETRFDRLPQARQMKVKNFFISLLVIYILCLLFSLFYIEVGYKSGLVVRYGFPLPWLMRWRYYAPIAEFYLLQFGFVIDSILYLALSAGLSFLIVNSRISRFHKRARSNRLYNWLIPRSP